MTTRTYYSEDARQRAQAERSFIAVLFLGLGMSIGAALALLFAPETGEELREDLANRANEMRGNVETLAS